MTQGTVLVIAFLVTLLCGLLVFIGIVKMTAPDPAVVMAACAARDIPVKVTPVFDEPRYDYTVSVPDIKRLTQDTIHTVHEAIPLGLARYESTLEFSTPVLVSTLPDGSSCAAVRNSDVTIGYKNVTIYIPHEIPQGSCGFDEVMAHEQKHIAVNRRILQEYAPRIEERLSAYLKAHGLFKSRNYEDDVVSLRQKLQAILDDMNRQMSDADMAAQNKVDSPEEYRRMGQVCDGQLRMIAGHALDARP